MASNSGYVIPSSYIQPTQLAIIMSSLPDKYILAEGEDGYYVYFKAYRKTPDLAIAKVSMQGGQVVYEILDENLGKELLADLKTKYPQCDDDRVVWGVFYPWYDGWAMAGQWSDKPDGLTAGLTSFVLERKPLLLSFRAGDFDFNMGTSLTSQIILDNGTVSDEDNGPVFIEMTNLERCVSDQPREELFRFDEGSALE